MLCVIPQKQKASIISLKKKKKVLFPTHYIVKKKKKKHIKKHLFNFCFHSLITVGQMTTSPLVLLPILTILNIF